jgi:hypothetical protein
MTFFPRLMVSIYNGLLRLYPRKFREEFRGEMQGVFVSAVKEAVRTGTRALLQLLFFEMLDFPINLAIEHFSQWRKVWSMKDIRHEIRPFRSAAMGALGLFIGLLIVLLGTKYLYLVLPSWLFKPDFGILYTLRGMILSALTYALASALLGLMLCLSVSASSRITLRACFFMAGLEVVATLIGTAIVRFTPYQSFILSFDGNWQDVTPALGTAFLAMIDGLFTGAGLGLAAGGWKFCWRFALNGMLAYFLGFAIGETIYSLWISSGWWIWGTTYPVFVITFCICGILAGGILGWLWGKERVYKSIRVVEGNPGSFRV